MQNVEYFDKRLILFDNPREEIISSDKKRLIVDAFARYINTVSYTHLRANETLR